MGAWAGGVFFCAWQEELIHLCQILSPPYLRNVLLQDIMRACMHRVKHSQGSGAVDDDNHDNNDDNDDDKDDDLLVSPGVRWDRMQPAKA